MAIKILELVGENESDTREEAILNEIKIMSEAASVRNYYMHKDLPFNATKNLQGSNYIVRILGNYFTKSSCWVSYARRVKRA